MWGGIILPMAFLIMDLRDTVYVECQSEILVFLMKVNFFLVSKNDQFHNEG